MPVELVEGRCYRAKKPGQTIGLVNDRCILRLWPDRVQYDGPAVALGRHYPIVSREQFEKWVGSDVTDSLPRGTWQDWRDYLKQKRKS